MTRTLLCSVRIDYVLTSQGLLPHLGPADILSMPPKWCGWASPACGQGSALCLGRSTKGLHGV